MRSQMAACRLAARRLDELFDKYGRETMLAAIEHIFDETETQVAATSSAQLPDGVYEAESFLDNDGVQQRAGAHPRQGHDRQGNGE